MSSIRCVLAEDDPFQRRILTDLLIKWGYEVVLANDGVQAWMNLERQQEPCIALLSNRLPQMEGVEVCRRLRERQANQRPYVILLGTQLTRGEVLQAVETVADDYVMKPVDPPELRVRMNLAHRLLDLQKAMEKHGARDLLTGALTRETVKKELEEELDRGRRQNTPVTVILCVIDDFARLVKAQGPTAGNAATIEAARRISLAMRNYDSLGVVGPGEFLIILPGCDNEAAHKQARRLQKALSADGVVTHRGMISLSTSVGVATADGSEHLGVAEMIEKAARTLVARRLESGVRPAAG